MADRESVVRDLRYVKTFGRVSNTPHLTEIAESALELLIEQDTVEHACDILRANGWTETEPICSECDAIHVVRCKDCKHREESVSPHWELWCNRLHCGCDSNWFCADGERREHGRNEAR